MLTITCTGTPYEIGHTHGHLASPQIRSSIAFYTTFFRETASLSYAAACQTALEFLPYLQSAHPDLVAELRGVADGAGLAFEEVLALNVRTEISYGMATEFGLKKGTAAGGGAVNANGQNGGVNGAYGVNGGSGGGNGSWGRDLMDGCTAIAYHTAADDGRDGRTALLGQNWDWRREQLPNLIRLRIKRSGGAAGTGAGVSTGAASASDPANGAPNGNGNSSANGTTPNGTNDPSPSATPQRYSTSIDMITEAGIIGKIGLNSAGVGVCLNAIRAPGVSYASLPVHLALRRVLDAAGTAVQAEVLLGEYGVASSAHVLVADGAEAVGLESSSRGVVRVGDGAGWGLGKQEGNEGDGARVVAHTNHYVMVHDGVSDGGGFVEDSEPRLRRIGELAVRAGDVVGVRVKGGGRNGRSAVDVERMKGWLRDEEGLPVSICRKASGESNMETLFSIVMDLRVGKGWVKAGRPTEDGEELEIDAKV